MHIQKFHTTCPMDCPDSCALEISTTNGTISSIRGSHNHPNTSGFICSKVARFARRVYHADRILYPMRRSGPKGSREFTRITWDEAVNEIVNQFKVIQEKWGTEAILPYHYGGSNGLLGEDFLDEYFFARLGASQIEKTLCAAPTTEVASDMYGKMPGIAFEDYPLAKFILIWGANPKNSNIHLVPYLKKAKENGAFIAAIDPVKNFSDTEIDMHLAIMPGTDLALALALIRFWDENNMIDFQFVEKYTKNSKKILTAAREWTIEEAAAQCKISKRQIEKLALTYSKLAPAVLRCGWGLERNRNGGRAVATVLSLPSLLGKFGIRGGGYTLSNSAVVNLDKKNIFGPYTWETRKFNMTRLGKILTSDPEPPVKALFIYNCNPAVTVPNQSKVLHGLNREDLFTVVFDQILTDSTLYADILLPATTFFEQKEIKRSYGSYALGGIREIIPAQGEAKSNHQLFSVLGRAMGWQDKAFSWDQDQLIIKICETIAIADTTLDYQTLLEGKTHPIKFAGGTPVQFVTVFPNTEDGKINLYPNCLGRNGFSFSHYTDSNFPLALISPANSKMTNSIMGEFNYPLLRITMNPDDADRRGISYDDTVRVFNDLGEVLCMVKIDARTRPSVVILPKGAWRKSSLNGYTSTVLCPDFTNEVAGGACYNDARVEVQKFSVSSRQSAVGK